MSEFWTYRFRDTSPISGSPPKTKKIRVQGSETRRAWILCDGFSSELENSDQFALVVLRSKGAAPKPEGLCGAVERPRLVVPTVSFRGISGAAVQGAVGSRAIELLASPTRLALRALSTSPAILSR
jgi:hypothetical protein